MPAAHAHGDERWRQRHLVALQQGAHDGLVWGGSSHGRDIAANGYRIKPGPRPACSATEPVYKQWNFWGRIMKHAIFAGALALAACQPAAETPAETAQPAATEAPASPAAAPAQPSGPAKTIEAEDDHMPEAWVTDVHHIKDADFKIFSTAGGDPAINGLYTYLAAFTPPDGWTRVYMLGDFNSWEVIEESPTRVVLKITRHELDQSTTEINTIEEKLIVDLPADPETPVTVTPAT